jgi:hypothetical protein
MAASGALQALLDKYSAWTPGSGVQQLPAWQPDNMNDPSAAMFGFGSPHVYWQSLPPPAPTKATILPPTGGNSGDQGLPGQGIGSAASGAGGNYSGPSYSSGGLEGAGGLGNGMGLGNGFGGFGSAPGSIGGFGGTGGSGGYEGSDSYLSGLESANGLNRGDYDLSSYTPSWRTVGSVTGSVAGGPIGGLIGGLLGSAFDPSKTEQAVQGTMSQGAMGVSIPSSTGGTPFTPDGSDPGGGHAVDSSGFVDGAGQNSSYSEYGTHAPAGGSGGSGWSEGGTHDMGGGQYGGVTDLSGGSSLRALHHDVSALAHGGSVAQAVGGKAFGRFMAGPMQSDPRTAQFAAQLKQAMSELAVALKGDRQASKVRAFFQANYVEPVEAALRKKDAEGAMRLCVAMMNEAHRIEHGERP